MMQFLDFRNRPAQEPGLRPELRHLIDAAVAAGRVKVIPRGVSAFPPPKWCEKEGRLVTEDGRTQAQKAADQRRAFEAARGRINSQTAERARKRRIEVAALMKAGLSPEAIANQRGEGLAGVKALCRLIRQGKIDPVTGVQK